MRPAIKRLLLVGTAAALAIPAIAQVQNTVAAPTVSNTPAPATQPAQPDPGPQPAQTETRPETVSGEAEQETLNQPPPTPIEYPRFARRDPFTAGALDPRQLGIGGDPWGMASGVFLSSLMRQMDTPVASRWLHIGLRGALLAAAHSPRGVNPVDWAAERAWLLLRMGEADAARMVISSVDTDRFTPKMTQVAVQSALANSDPLALCAIGDGLRKAEPRIVAIVQAICSGLNGESELASAQIESARRRGPIGGIDLALAQKVVGATSDSGTATTIEWEPVEALTAWRYGLATATAMSPPARLLDSATPRLRAWHARAPLIPFQDRLESARIATGLGVFSSRALIDFYSWIYDSTDPNELGGSDAWQLRLAFAANDQGTRLAAMRQLWRLGGDRLQREASRAMLATAASRIQPARQIQGDASNLIASMLAAGLDSQAARWTDVVGQMDGGDADTAWAMLALGAPDGAGVDVSPGRVNAFIGRDSSKGRKRSALLVAGLAALGRLDAGAASRLNSRHGLNIGRSSRWTHMIDAAARRDQTGSVLVLAGTGLQAADFESLPSSQLFHIVMALRNSGQEFLARMVAAEALART
ncbi:MAG TPA: hypothetical protein VHN55_00525 [Sphingomicrobium sp.]|nr:hypothetical protein [Sphingomicrobium sp.]